LRVSIKSTAATALLALLAASCATESGVTVPPESEVVNSQEVASTVNAECAASFQQAAAVRDMWDTNEDMIAAAVNCTFDEAEAMDDRYPAALDGIAPMSFFANFCRGTNYGSRPVSDATFPALVARASGTVGDTLLCRDIR